MRKILLVLCVLAASLNLSAQVNTGVKFRKLVHDFGNVNEETGSVSAIFSFANISSKPIQIDTVQTSCGCTKPEYSRNIIMPGDTGFVKAIYETRGRDGAFNKNLYVYFNEPGYYTSLGIKGNVIPEANLSKKPPEYTTTYSNLAFTTTIAYFPSIFKSEKKSYRIKVFNYMGYPIRIYEVKSKPEYVSIDLGDSLLEVEDTLTIAVTVDGSMLTQFGDLRDPVSLLTDDAGNDVKFIYVWTNLKEDFSKVKPRELKKAPKIHMDTIGPLNFGKRSAGEKFSYTLKITNTGKKELNIRNVIPSCSCVSFSLPRQLLQPGESVNLVLTVDTVNQIQAELVKYVTIVTNDPAQSEIKIKLLMTITN